MHLYRVKYRNKEGKEVVDNIEGCDAGNVFAKCLKIHPDSIPISALRSGDWKDGHGETLYIVPPVLRHPVKEPRPYRAPKPDELDGIMPFYNQVLSERR